SRVGVIFLQAVMEALLAFLNHFPLFAIMLRFKDPDRLPGGLRFETCDSYYFTAYKTSLARVVRVLKYFLPWSNTTRKHENNHASSIVEPVPSSSKEYLRQIRGMDGEKGDNVIRIRKNRTDLVDGQWYATIPQSPSEQKSRPSVSDPPRCLVSGETIRPIPRLQYPMLPETRPPLRRLIDRLCDQEEPTR
ncbi:5457_t:CDS:2, partial [Paraglomus occultum]